MNSDTANEVIHMSLPMLGMTASERDYQFWLSAGKEPLYLLIGHEYPYGSKKSHLQDTELLTLVSKGPISPSNLQEPFLMDQQLRKMQHQLILKPSLLVAAQQLSALGQKIFKRIRTIINWAFWWVLALTWITCPCHQHLLCQDSSLECLPYICENNNLPKPILDMLSFLSQKNPLTKSIFRQSARGNTCRELKETEFSSCSTPRL